MIRRLNEGRGKTSRRVIYEGNGFCKVIENGRVVERIQLERGDNLMEAFGGRSLTEGRGSQMRNIKSESDFITRLAKSERLIGKPGLYTDMKPVTNFGKYQNDLDKIIEMGAFDNKSLRGSYYKDGETLSIKGIGPSKSEDWYFEGVENILQAVQILEWGFNFKKLDIEDATPSYKDYVDSYTDDFTFELRL